MTITIRANELNTILYKYFLQTGLTHTAYSLFNQANLAPHLQQYRYDIKAGHLITLLERALIYSQIQAHVSLSQYTECTQPFYLLKPHTCKVVQVVRKQKQEMVRELGQQLNDSIRRTNSIYNTALPNKQIAEIVYQPRGSNFLQKFPKIRIPDNQKVRICGNQGQPLLVHTQDNQVDLLKYDQMSQQITVQRILPIVSQGKLMPARIVQISGSWMVQVFENGFVSVLSLEQELGLVEFRIDNLDIKSVLFNQNLSHVVCLAGQHEYAIVNLKTSAVLKRQSGSLCWKNYDQYVRRQDGKLTLSSLCKPEPLLSIESDLPWQSVSFNSEKNLFAAINYTYRLIHVYTVQSDIPLFIFDLTHQTDLIQLRWIQSNGADYLCWLTSERVCIYDISLDSYAKIINLGQYQMEASNIWSLRKAEKDEMYLICQGESGLLLYDITNCKLERIEFSFTTATMIGLGAKRLCLQTQTCIYWMVGSYIDSLFK